MDNNIGVRYPFRYLAEQILDCYYIHECHQQIRLVDEGIMCHLLVGW